MNKWSLVISVVALFLGGQVYSKTNGKKGGATLSLEQIVKKLEDSYTQVNSLTSEFTQVIDSPYWGVKRTTGKVYLNRPEKMRWDYMGAKDESGSKEKAKKSSDTGIQRFFLADGKQIVLYDAKMSQAMVESQPKAGDIPLGLALLLGQKKLSDFFVIKLLSQSQEKAELDLVPKVEQAGISHIELQLSLSTPAQILRTRVYDQMGVKNEIQFEDIQVNAKIPNTKFEAEYPDGTVVVQGFSGTPLM